MSRVRDVPDTAPWPWIPPSGVSSADRSAATDTEEMSSLSAPPWSLWAAYFGEHLALGADGVAVSEAVGLLSSTDDVERWAAAAEVLSGVEGGASCVALLLQLGSRRTMRWPANPELGSCKLLDREPLSPSTSYREAALTFTLPAVAVGEPAEPWASFGAALGPAIDLMHGLHRLFRDEAIDVVESSLNPVIATLIRLDVEVPELLLRWAGSAGQPHRATEIQTWLSRRVVRDALIEHWRSTLLPSAKQRIPRTHIELCESFIDGLDRRFAWYESYLATTNLVFELLHGTPGWSASCAREDLALALDYLRRKGDWPDSWEVRAGLFEHRERLVASWFNRGYILRALHQTGEPVEERIRALLAEGEPEGLRWYGAWRGIPPDADSLGLALDLASRVGFPAGKVEGWLRPLMCSLQENKIVTTWFYEGPEGPTMDHEFDYKGGECTAVRLALLLGMMRYDATRFRELVEANLSSVLDRHRDGRLLGVVFYDYALTEAIFVQVMSCYLESFAEGGQTSRVRLARDEVAERIGRAQRLDGGWGSPQSTAYRLLALTLTNCAVEDRLRALRYLSEAQNPDGSWTAEPFYLMPGKGDSMAWHRGRELTTAICARSISVALDGGGHF